MDGAIEKKKALFFVILNFLKHIQNIQVYTYIKYTDLMYSYDVVSLDLTVTT